LAVVVVVRETLILAVAEAVGNRSEMGIEMMLLLTWQGMLLDWTLEFRQS
jgi:hypothetical protein